MHNAESSKAIRIAAGTLGFFLMSVIVIYLINCLRKGSVELFGRFGSRKFVKQDNPLSYWLTMGSYALLAVGILVLLVIATFNLIAKG